MTLLTQAMPWIQIVLAVLLTALILLQRSGAELGGAFGGGGDGSGGATYTRRGAEKIIFTATIVIAVLFVVVSLLALFVVRG